MYYITNIFSTQYLMIFWFILFSLFLGCVILGLSYFIAIQNPDSEKTSAYECGFEPFEDARNKFDVRFYIVAILFIIFDIEVLYLFPWAVSLYETGLEGFWAMMAFLILLGVGFLYEVFKGALDWQ